VIVIIALAAWWLGSEDKGGGTASS
jgi:hypothetical protein